MDEILSLITNMLRELDEIKMLLAQTPTPHNCMTCDSFNQIKEVCKLYNTRPPAKVIAVGCEKFTNDVPF